MYKFTLNLKNSNTLIFLSKTFIKKIREQSKLYYLTHAGLMELIMRPRVSLITKWYGKTLVTSCELRIMSYELRVESLKARVEIQKCEFKSTSY